jgi:hypothetical protein
VWLTRTVRAPNIQHDTEETEGRDEEWQLSAHRSQPVMLAKQSLSDEQEKD